MQFQSTRGSIHYYQGEFYNSHWGLVYVPLTDYQAERFMDLVQKMENRVNRILTIVEVDSIVTGMLRE